MENNASPRNISRLGLRLFAVYAVCYTAFVLTSAFAAPVMEREAFAGLNVAIVSGFGLIVLALVLALVYGVRGGGKRHDTPHAPSAGGAR
ncbi:DUF485 domain-containing protein [Botrimarina sp.]|uniref:DUF485 domain-containing protein n=1 Tax=Botrimarina sp. TaxID=2795802 RepID=UPI0032EA93D5